MLLRVRSVYAVYSRVRLVYADYNNTNQCVSTENIQ